MKTLRKAAIWMISAAAALLVLTGAAAASDGRMLIPGGHTIGIKAYARGLVVTGVESGSPAQKAGIRQGDILCSVNGQQLRTVEQLTGQMTRDVALRLELTRGEKNRTVLVTPQKTEEGCRLGAFVRDNIAGIGTVSYYDPETGEFGALGHGIGDLTGSGLLPIAGGEVIASRVREVIRGVSGSAGQLKGEFDTSTAVGRIASNTESGVFGTAAVPDGTPIPIADPKEIRPGPAVIYSNVVDDEVGTYDVRILKCYDPETSSGRNMLLRITDPELIRLTGGIVQGMSGSPIIQEGKLVGAVTHVLVNDPTTGYGIFIENMLDAAE